MSAEQVSMLPQDGDTDRIGEIEGRLSALKGLPWWLDHDDTFVGEELDPMKDWKWVVGNMADSVHDEEDMRGTKEEIQAKCRFIKNAPEDIAFLLKEVRRLKGMI